MGDTLPPGHAGLSLCATEPMPRAAPSSETRRPSSMARHDGNNWLYNIRHSSTEESTHRPAPHRAPPGQCRGDKWGQKCWGSCQTQGQHSQQLPGTASRVSCGRAVPRGRPLGVLPALPEPRLSAAHRTPQPRQPYGTTACGATANAALRLHRSVKGTPQPAWHRYGNAATGHHSWMETSLLGPPRSAVCLPGLASVNGIQPYVTGYYFTTFIQVSALFDYKPVPTQLQTHR